MERHLSAIYFRGVNGFFRLLATRAVSGAKFSLIKLGVFSSLTISVHHFQAGLVVRVEAIRKKFGSEDIGRSRIFLGVILRFQDNYHHRDGRQALTSFICSQASAAVFQARVVPPFEGAVYFIRYVGQGVSLTRGLRVFVFNR